MADEQRHYEFTEQQNQVIKGLAQGMAVVAIPFIVLGVLYTIAFVLNVIRCFQDPGHIPATFLLALVTVLVFALGVWQRRASESFKNVVHTQGSDIPHLMDALDNLRKMYRVLSTIVIAYLLLVLIALVAAIILAFVRQPGKATPKEFARVSVRSSRFAPAGAWPGTGRFATTACAASGTLRVPAATYPG
jgi:hypothetical protein